MIIKYLGSAENLLSIDASEIVDYIGNIGNFSSVTLKVTQKCSETSLEKEYDNIEILDDTNDFFIEEETLYVKPILLGLTSFEDSVVKIEVKFNKIDSGGYIIISNCIFIDVTYKCKVASLLQELLEESEAVAGGEIPSTYVHLLHYGLTNGSNCGCNCEELCKVFDALTEFLTGVDPKITNDCGC